MPVRVIQWSGNDPPTEAEIVRRMRAEGLSPSGWSNGFGDRYGVHSHTYHKALYCVSGSIRLTLPGAGMGLRPATRVGIRRPTASQPPSFLSFLPHEAQEEEAERRKGNKKEEDK